ncbi:MAG: porin, partial [Phycisphaerales bacterium]
ASPDGNFSLKVSGQLQVRYVLNSRKGDQKLGPFNPPNTQWGFENRRTKLSFSGNVFDKSWTYKIKGAFARAGGNFFLEDGYVQKKLDGGLAIKVGQFKAPWMREELVSSSKQLTVDRSIVNGYFRQGYSQGVQLGYEAESFRAWVWAGDGIGSRGFGPARFNSQNTNWDRTATNYSFAGRAEYKISGDWSQFKDFSSKRGSNSGMMAGVSAVTQRANQNLSADVDGTKVYGITGDFTWDMSGASLFVSGVWTNVDSPTGDDSNPWGVTIQGGYFVTESVEAFVRYEYMDFDPSIRTNAAKYDGFTVGGNWFINSSVRFSADFSYNFASLAAGAFVASSAGFRADEPGEDGQWAIRAQLQLLF